MPLLQVTYEVPEDIAMGLASGKMKRFGSVVRDNTKIIEHLKEIDVKNSEEKANGNKAAAIACMIGAGVVVTGALGFGVGYFIKKNQLKKALKEFQNAFIAYKDAIQNGELNEEVLCKLDSSLERIHDLSHKGWIKIDYVPEVFGAFKEILADYTKQLAEKNQIAYENNNLESDSDDKIIDIRKYLHQQSEIINACSQDV